MKPSSPAWLSLALSLWSVEVDAFWRMTCGTIQTGRVDPIVSPGSIAGHVHTIAGAKSKLVSYSLDGGC